MYWNATSDKTRARICFAGMRSDGLGGTVNIQAWRAILSSFMPSEHGRTRFALFDCTGPDDLGIVLLFGFINRNHVFVLCRCQIFAVYCTITCEYTILISPWAQSMHMLLRVARVLTWLYLHIVQSCPFHIFRSTGTK